MRFFILCALILVLLFSGFSNSAFAATPANFSSDTGQKYSPGSIVRFEHLNIENGLSQNAGLAIFQDSRGYLWIGSQDGLNRYDGYTFTIFKNDPEDPTSLSYNSILSIGETSDGALWIGTWGGGLNRFDPRTEKFTSYRHSADDPGSLSDDTVTSIREDTSGALWVGTLGGLDRFEPQKGGFEHFRNGPNDPETLSSNAVSTIFQDSRGRLWIGTGAVSVEGAGLNLLDPATGKIIRYQHNPSNPKSLASNNIAAIYEAPDGALWIATGGFSLPGNGLDQFDPLTGTAQHFVHDPTRTDSLSGNDLICLWGDASGVLWIGTWANGLNRMELSSPGHFAQYRYDPFSSDSLSGDEIWSLFRDHAGTLWVGTSHSGVNKLPANSGQFNLFRNSPSKPESLAANATGAFAEDAQGNIWIATWGGGLDRLDPTSGHFEHFRHDPTNPASLADDLFMAVWVDSIGRVWAGTLGKGLERLDPLTGQVTHYRHDSQNPASLADDNVAALLPDNKGGLWVGTFGGLAHYDPASDSFTNYVHSPVDASSLSENKVVSLYIDTKNSLWVGTWGGGLNQLDLNSLSPSNPQLATFRHYRNRPDDTTSLSEDSVWAIHETAKGSLWLGTQAGLNQFDPAQQTFHRYTEKDGLPNNVILGILEDDQGKLWLTTNNGLSAFDPQNGNFKNYDASDGLQSNEFNSNAYFRSRNGTLYIGGINGFNAFKPEEIRPNPIPPRVAVTRFDVFNHPLSVDLSGSQTIELSYKQDFISFEFAALDFQAPQKNRYAYKLEGFDPDWIDAGNRRYASYTNLPGGQYVFRVKASNSDGIWNETGVALPIVITPPVWQTPWFLGLLILAVTALMVGGFRWRLNAIREQNFRLEMEISERTAELREANVLLEKEVEQRKRAEAALSKRAADQLKQSEARFQAVFENAAVGIAIMGLDRHVLAFNPISEQIIGYSAEELRNIDPRSLAIAEDREMDSALFHELVDGQRNSYVMERRYRRRDGRIFWARINYSLVRDLDGKPDYLIGIIEDIDDQKRSAEKLAEQEAEYRRTLEQRVEERTHELQEANARLQEEMAQRQKAELALAEKAAQEAVAIERTRLARDLHDAVTQTLFSASLIAEVLPDIWELNQAEGQKRIEELRQLTRGALAEMRTLLVELRPNALTEIPLPDLLRQLCESLIGRARLPIQFNVEGQRKLLPDVQIGLYRIAQEALNNVVKHAKATQAVVTLRLNGNVRLSVADNGCGFDPTGIPPDHLGLKIMCERAESIGAHFSIYSEPGEGTQISITWEEKDRP